MTEFKASSGLIVRVSDVGNIRLYGVDGHNRLQGFDFLNETDVQALREFFAQERKEKLPFRYGDCWVFPIGDSTDIRCVIVVGHNTYTVFVEGGTDSDTALAAAAQAYFAAHPGPKPWLDAQTGEVWSISDGYADSLAICSLELDQDSSDYHPYFYGPNFDGIRGDALTSGTRLEVQS